MSICNLDHPNTINLGSYCPKMSCLTSSPLWPDSRLCIDFFCCFFGIFYFFRSHEFRRPPPQSGAWISCFAWIMKVESILMNFFEIFFNSRLPRSRSHLIIGRVASVYKRDRPRRLCFLTAPRIYVDPEA